MGVQIFEVGGHKHHLGWFYTSAQNAAFETLAVKHFLYYLHSSVPTTRW